MAKPITVHTVDSLLARTVEEGDCRLWQGFSTNDTPMVYDGAEGKMASVRKLIHKLDGGYVSAKYFCASCGNPLCVAPEHIIQRNEKTQCRQMAKQSIKHKAKRSAAVLLWRRANPLKLDMDRARQIRADERPYQAIADDFGVSKSMVGKIKRGQYWRDNPWSALFAMNDSFKRAA